MAAVTYHGPGQVVISFHRPPARGLLREGIRLPHRRSRDPYAAAPLGVTGHRVSGGTRHLCAPGRSRRPRAAPSARKRCQHRTNFDGLGKIAQIGIKVSRIARTTASLNVAMDLEPFLRINPCGYSGLQNGGPFYNRRVGALAGRCRHPEQKLGIPRPETHHEHPPENTIRTRSQSRQNTTPPSNRRRMPTSPYPHQGQQGEVLKNRLDSRQGR